MVATSGAQLLPEAAVETLCNELLPITQILTPNIPEANLILQAAGKTVIDVQSVASLKKLALAVQSLGPNYVLLKGGHHPFNGDGLVARTENDKSRVVNVLVGDEASEVIEFPYLKSRNTHGTGCSLACKLVSGLRSILLIR